MEMIPFLRPAIAIALAEARHKAGLTQPQLADFSGLSRSYIAALEAGETSFSCESLYALLEVMRTDVVAFFTRVEELRAQKPVISKPGRGRRRSVTLGSNTPTRAQAKKRPGCSAEVRIFYTLAHASSKEGPGMIPAA